MSLSHGANGHFTVGGNSSGKLETFKYFRLFTNSPNSINEEVKVELKQETHINIQPKHFCPLELS